MINVFNVPNRFVYHGLPFIVTEHILFSTAVQIQMFLLFLLQPCGIGDGKMSRGAAEQRFGAAASEERRHQQDFSDQLYGGKLALHEKRA